MASIKYDDVYSKFYTKVEAFDFLFEDMSDEMIAEFMSEWLHSAVAYPYIRRLFVLVGFDDEAREFQYELKYSIDDFTDYEFVKEVLAYGMVYSWTEPKVRSITNIYQNFTSTEQKLEKDTFFHSSLYWETLQCIPSNCWNTLRDILTTT